MVILLRNLANMFLSHGLLYRENIFQIARHNVNLYRFKIMYSFFWDTRYTGLQMMQVWTLVALLNYEQVKGTLTDIQKTVFRKVLLVWSSLPIFSFTGYTLTELYRKPENCRQIYKQMSSTFIHQTMCQEETNY